MLRVLDASNDVLTSKLMKAHDNRTMGLMCEKNMLFSNFAYARYAKDRDRRFQGENQPSGLNFIEAKEHYCEKYKFYGFKIKESLIPNGLCIYSVPYARGGVPDILLSRRNLHWHPEAVKK